MKQFKEHVRKYWAIWLGVLLFGGFLLPYIVVFGPHMSTKQSVWADFGNYIGGAVGPLFSLVAIVLVLQTLHVQQQELQLSRKELELTRVELKKSGEALAKQAKQFDEKSLKDDLFGRANAVHQELQNLMDTPIAFKWTTGAYPHNMSPSRSLPKIGEIFRNPNNLELVVPESEKPNSFRMVEAVRPIIARLHELARYLWRIDQLSDGSRMATDFFRLRQQDLAYGLHRAGYITEDLLNEFTA